MTLFPIWRFWDGGDIRRAVSFRQVNLQSLSFALPGFILLPFHCVFTIEYRVRVPLIIIFLFFVKWIQNWFQLIFFGILIFNRTSATYDKFPTIRFISHSSFWSNKFWPEYISFMLHLYLSLYCSVCVCVYVFRHLRRPL